MAMLTDNDNDALFVLSYKDSAWQDRNDAVNYLALRLAGWDSQRAGEMTKRDDSGMSRFNRLERDVEEVLLEFFSTAAVEKLPWIQLVMRVVSRDSNTEEFRAAVISAAKSML